jgi:DNA replicative helicase MCM subunit Mcm2 (Cdc46/Mcm family)
MQKQEIYLNFQPDFDLEKTKILEFLKNFTDNSREEKIHGRRKYMNELQKISNKQGKVLTIFKEDLEEYFHKDYNLYKSIITNTKRYLKILYEIVDDIMPTRSIQIMGDVFLI